MRRSNGILHRSTLVLTLVAGAMDIARGEQPPRSARVDFALPAAAPTNALDPNAPTVGASVDRTEAHVGDRLTLTVSAVAHTGVAKTVRLVTHELGRFEILDDSASDHDLGDGRTSRRFVLQIAAYALGELEVPPIALEYRTSDGASRRLETTAIPVHVTRLVEDPAAEPMPLARTRDVMVEDRRWVHGLIAAGVAVGLLLAGLLARALVRRHRRRARIPCQAPQRPPHEVALERLSALEARGGFDAGAYQPFHFEVAEIVRAYLGERFGFDSLELTTTELIEELRALAQPVTLPPVMPAGGGASTQGDSPPRLSPEQLATLTGFFEACDLVKFAKAPSSEPAARQLLMTAAAFVRQTQPISAGGAHG